MQHIIVTSHRRSGTHLTIDAILNNFSEYRKLPYLNIDRLTNAPTGKHLSLDDLKQELARGPRVLKTHYLPTLAEIDDPEAKEFVSQLFRDSKKIYIARDGKDVMVSLYYYMQPFTPEVKEMSFSQFLRTPHNFDKVDHPMTRPAFWQHHIQSWMEAPYGEMLYINFSDFRKNYPVVMHKIADFVGQPIDGKLVDVIRKPETGLLHKILVKLKLRKPAKQRLNLTSISFRKGKVGDSIEHFQPEDVEFFNQHGGEGMKIIQKLKISNE